MWIFSSFFQMLTISDQIYVTELSYFASQNKQVLSILLGKMQSPPLGIRTDKSKSEWYLLLSFPELFTERIYLIAVIHIAWMN